jgi:transposase
LEALTLRLDEAEDRIVKLEAEIARLKAQNLALHRRQFKARRRAPAPAPQDKPGKKRGAPLGHPAWQRPKPEKIDRTVIVPAPDACPHCHLSNLTPVNEMTQHIQEDIVLEPRVVATCYQHRQAYCPHCQRTVCQSGPGELPGSYIGPADKSTSTYLRHTLGISHRKISRFFHEFFGLRFAPASSLGFDTQAARKGLPLYEDAHAKIQASSLVHADETYWRHDGQNHIVWYAGHQDLAFFNFTQHRSTKEAQELLGEKFGGILVADAYASYNGVHPKDRQSCLAHLIRKAKEMDQTLALLEPALQEAPARQLCQKTADLFSRACRAAHLFHTGELSAEQALAREKELRGELASLCRQPLCFAPAESFRKRLTGPEQPLFFTCLREPNVPPTNNQAEQSLRPIVIMRKIIQCTRGEAGLQNHSVLHTLIQTARRQGCAVRQFLETLLRDNTATAQAALYRNTS